MFSVLFNCSNTFLFPYCRIWFGPNKIPGDLILPRNTKVIFKFFNYIYCVCIKVKGQPVGASSFLQHVNPWDKVWWQSPFHRVLSPKSLFF